MCEYKVDREEKLAKLPYDLADSPYYRMIMEDGSDEMKAKVEGYRKACFPAYCDRVINTSLDRKEMENAAKILEEFPDIPHRDEFLKACREKLAVFDRVMDDLEYIQDRIEEIPKECHREGRKAKLQDKLVEMADHVRGKFKGCGFVPLIVHLPDCNSLFGGFGGASYYVEAGALGQELVMSSEVQLVMMLVDKNLTKLVVSDYGEHRYSEKAEPEHRKEIAVKFADSKLAVLHINVNAFRYGLDVDFL